MGATARRFSEIFVMDIESIALKRYFKSNQTISKGNLRCPYITYQVVQNQSSVFYLTLLQVQQPNQELPYNLTSDDWADPGLRPLPQAFQPD